MSKAHDHICGILNRIQAMPTVTVRSAGNNTLRIIESTTPTINVGELYDEQDLYMLASESNFIVYDEDEFNETI